LGLVCWGRWLALVYWGVLSGFGLTLRSIKKEVWFVGGEEQKISVGFVAVFLSVSGGFY